MIAPTGRPSGADFERWGFVTDPYHRGRPGRTHTLNDCPVGGASSSSTFSMSKILKQLKGSGAPPTLSFMRTISETLRLRRCSAARLGEEQRNETFTRLLQDNNAKCCLSHRALAAWRAISARREPGTSQQREPSSASVRRSKLLPRWRPQSPRGFAKWEGEQGCLSLTRPRSPSSSSSSPRLPLASPQWPQPVAKNHPR